MEAGDSEYFSSVLPSSVYPCLVCLCAKRRIDASGDGRTTSQRALGFLAVCEHFCWRGLLWYYESGSQKSVPTHWYVSVCSYRPTLNQFVQPFSMKSFIDCLCPGHILLLSYFGHIAPVLRCHFTFMLGFNGTHAGCTVFHFCAVCWHQPELVIMKWSVCAVGRSLLQMVFRRGGSSLCLFLPSLYLPVYFKKWPKLSFSNG